MKIDIRCIPAEGLNLEEDLSPVSLDLDSEIIKFKDPIRVKAEVSRITNAVTLRLSVSTLRHANCSRCLNDFSADINKQIVLNYCVDESMDLIDLEPIIREELVLDSPIKPLCRTDCRGICFKCGKNLNEGGCSCGIT